MNIDELFQEGHKRQKYSKDNHYGQDDHHHSGDDSADLKQQLLKMLQNPKLRSLLIIVAVIIAIAVVVAIILLFPLILKLFAFISENGVQGILDAVLKGAN